MPAGRGDELMNDEPKNDRLMNDERMNARADE